jgi:hypothetical protein
MDPGNYIMVTIDFGALDRQPLRRTFQVLPVKGQHIVIEGTPWMVQDVVWRYERDAYGRDVYQPTVAVA